MNAERRQQQGRQQRSDDPGVGEAGPFECEGAQYGDEHQQRQPARIDERGAGHEAFMPFLQAMAAPVAHAERDGRHHQHHAQAVRGGHLAHVGAMALALHRHLGRAADSHGKEGGGLVDTRQAPQQQCTNAAQRQREQHGAGDPRRIDSQDGQHGRREIQAQGRADGPLARLAHAHGASQLAPRQAQRGRGEQGADHPRQRRVQPQADGGARQPGGQRGADGAPAWPPRHR